jgi:hypothetical protein
MNFWKSKPQISLAERIVWEKALARVQFFQGFSKQGERVLPLGMVRKGIEMAVRLRQVEVQTFSGIPHPLVFDQLQKNNCQEYLHILNNCNGERQVHVEMREPAFLFLQECISRRLMEFSAEIEKFDSDLILEIEKELSAAQVHLSKLGFYLTKQKGDIWPDKRVQGLLQPSSGIHAGKPSSDSVIALISFLNRGYERAKNEGGSTYPGYVIGKFLGDQIGAIIGAFLLFFTSAAADKVNIRKEDIAPALHALGLLASGHELTPAKAYAIHKTLPVIHSLLQKQRKLLSRTDDEVSELATSAIASDIHRHECTLEEIQDYLQCFINEWQQTSSELKRGQEEKYVVDRYIMSLASELSGLMDELTYWQDFKPTRVVDRAVLGLPEDLDISPEALASAEDKYREDESRRQQEGDLRMKFVNHASPFYKLHLTRARDIRLQCQFSFSDEDVDDWVQKDRMMLKSEIEEGGPANPTLESANSLGS